VTVIALLAALAMGAGAAAERPAACVPLVASAAWDGGTLVVRPTQCGRRIARQRPGQVLAAAATAAAGAVPPPNARSLRDQLRCHALFAPFKPDWNLEVERPAVSWPALIATACNPPAA
jgi:hypothetical protein